MSMSSTDRGWQIRIPAAGARLRAIGEAGKPVEVIPLVACYRDSTAETPGSHCAGSARPVVAQTGSPGHSRVELHRSGQYRAVGGPIHQADVAAADRNS
jgi:hypothetical protein